ncbi:MAG TPA: DUF5668 domain-containing protein [Candidatus Polarisedimenticolia bacterium]|jgi:predicted membrane protein
MNPRLLMGIVIIFVGALLLAGNLHIFEVVDIWRFWPVILIAAGLNMLFRSRWGRGWEGGVVLTVLGGAFLLRNLGMLDWRFKQFWPILLVLFGVMIVVSALRAGTPVKKPASDSSPTFNLFTMLGAVEHKNDSRTFSGGEATAVLGGIELDLRDATMADAGAELQIFAFMGGVEIKVPQDWSVEVKGMPIMGYFGDTSKTRPTGDGRKLVVRGQAVMGAVEIKN